MIWGAFSGDQQSNVMVIPNCQRKAVDFVDLLYNGELLGFLGKIDDCMLMEDGAPTHSARVSSECLKQNGVDKMVGQRRYPISILLRIYGIV